MKKFLIGLILLIVAFFIYAGATYEGRQTDCCKDDPEDQIADILENSITVNPENSVPVDEDLAALVPEYLDAQSLSWLAGSWIKTGGNCDANNGDGFIHFYVDNGWMMGRANSEVNSETSERTNGRVDLNPGVEDGQINITPPGWNNAYWRATPTARDRLKIVQWEFKKETTDWQAGKAFKLYKCL